MKVTEEGSTYVGVWWQNVKHLHERWMMRFLQKRGWVVFYLEEPARECRAVCWMKEYCSWQTREVKVRVSADAK